MPELPEVETIRNELLPAVVGCRISDIELAWDGIIKQSSVDEFRARVVGRKVTGLERRGKYLLFGLDGGDILVVHLKMTGSLLRKPAAETNERFARAVIHLDSGQSLVFRDPRKFGRMWLVEDSKEVTNRLGPEPLAPDFAGEQLAGLLAGRTAPIKAVLLDQHIIAGIGSMYADEALFAAGIHPIRPAGSLSPVEIERLFKEIRRILRAAIGDKGASVENYYRPDGSTGTAHYRFKVAHRRGEDCPVCRTPLQRIVVRNRGTYLCPKCQPEPSGHSSGKEEANQPSETQGA